MSNLVAAKPIGCHSREGGNPAQAHVQSTQAKASAAQGEQTGFPPEARGNDTSAGGKV
jgi:hypothetical protein